MDIRKISINELKMAAYNPRVDLQPEDADYQSIEKSINEFGYVTPIVWNERTGNVVGGHQRLKILIAKGITEVEVSCVNLSEEKEKMLNITLNKVSGQWDRDKLEDVLKDIIDSVDDITITGFSMEEINNIVANFEEDVLDSFFVEEMPTDKAQSNTGDTSKELDKPDIETTHIRESEEPDSKRKVQCPCCGAWIQI